MDNFQGWASRRVVALENTHNIDQAVLLHQSGRLEEAAAIYQQILQAIPDDYSALYLLGVIAHQQQDHARAIELLERATKADPQRAEPHNVLGLALQGHGNFDKARKHLQSAIELDPACAQAHHNLGAIFARQGRAAEAMESYRRALALDPAYVNAHYSLGMALADAGQLDQGLEHLQRAVALDAEFVAGFKGLAWVFQKLNRSEDVLAALQIALRLQPDNPETHCGLGSELHRQKRFTEARETYEKALELGPQSSQAWCGLGCAQIELREEAAAAASLEQAVKLNPASAQARGNLGTALYKLGQVDHAVEHLREAEKLAPNLHWRSALAVIIPGSQKADNETILRTRRQWADSLPLPGGPGKQSPGRLRPRPARDDSEPLRVGYASTFFQDRNWMKPVWALVNQHDLERFEVHLFSDAPLAQVRYGYRPRKGLHYHDTSALSNETLARFIEDQRIDILVDLNAFSKVNRLPLFALKPAPVAAAWFNMYATSGMTCFDFLIGDEQVIPPEEEPFYTEKIVRVPGSYLTFEVNYPVPEVAPPPCRELGYITFGSLSSLYKITPEVMQAWAAILRACPNCRLLLKNSSLDSARNRDFVLAGFAKLGVEAGRLILEGRSGHFEFLKKYDEVDIALDTFPYSGGTTTTEAIWQGVPVLTYRGDRWVSRTSASILVNGGLSEYVVAGQDAYVERAIELARSLDTPAMLEELRADMRQRLLRSAVCDADKFARSMEGAFTQMWEQHRPGGSSSIA